MEPTPPSRPKPARRKFILLRSSCVLALARRHLGRSQKWSYGRSHESTDNAQVDGHLVPVLAKVGGYVTAVSVGENDHVKEGAELVQIDDAEYEVRLAQAEADLAAARRVAGGRGVDRTGRGAGADRDGPACSRSTRRSRAAQANRQKAVSDLARMEELADKQIVSRQQLDAAQAAADAAPANLVAAAASGQRGRRGHRRTPRPACASRRRDSARAQAARDNAALQLVYTRVTAPVAGIVSRKQVEVGPARAGRASRC